MKTLFVVFCVYGILLTFLPFGNLQQDEDYICSGISTCKKCIQKIGCAWCVGELKNNEPKCFNPDMQHPCPLRFHPLNEQTLIKTLPITTTDSLDTNSGPHNTDPELVQLSPQHIALKLRGGGTTRFEVQYSRGRNLPMEVYYLIDASLSMQTEKDNLNKLANDIVDSLRNITTDFRVGLGIFLNGKDPRSSENLATRSFQNYIQLTKNTTAFLKAVSDVVDSISIDAPKGTLDALMQAILCVNDIDWTATAKRLIILPTNNEYNSPKFADGLPPHDGKCHMDSTIYTFSNRMDFPTISEINRKSSDYGIDILFAVDALRLDSYNQLSNQIAESSVVVLSENMTNIISESILHKYLHMKYPATLRDDSPYVLQINYFSNCMEKQAKPWNTYRCEGIRIGDTITFEVEVNLWKCPTNENDWFKTFRIYPVGTDISLEVEIEMLCGCTIGNCSGQTSVEPSSRTCPLGHFGRHCECAGDISERDPLGCHHNNETIFACSGRGICICDVCECYARTDPTTAVSGKYCECDNYSCNRKNGLLCAGHGTCECGECRCLPGFAGSGCECILNNEQCISPDGGEICSGHGECICGECSCDATTEGRYFGKYCEKCPTCSTTCQQLKSCVECTLFEGIDFPARMCADKCKSIPISVPGERFTISDDDTHCFMYHENDCRFQFKFKEDSNGEQIVHVLNMLNCPPR